MNFSANNLNPKSTKQIIKQGMQYIVTLFGRDTRSVLMNHCILPHFDEQAGAQSIQIVS
jgi:hypothetical protein